MKTIKELETFLNEDTCWSVVNVYDGTLSEMSRIGKLPKSQFEIHIEGSEGSTPYFHLQKHNGKKENCICHIKLLSAEYLRGKDDPNNTISSQEAKALNDYMHKNAPGLNVSNWKIILSKWNEMNPSHMVKIDKTKMPDYTQLHT